MTRLGDIRFAAIDFESAGSAPGQTDEPVQIAIAHFEGSEITRSFASYLLPTRPVTWAARAVHQLADSQLAGAPRLPELWPQIREGLEGRWVVAHGAGTEKRFLRIFPLHGFGPWVDTLVLVRAVYPGLASHSLGDVIRDLGLLHEPEICGPGFRWHDAGCDAAASLVLLRHLISVTGLEEADALLRPNLSAYFAARKSQRPMG